MRTEPCVCGGTITASESSHAIRFAVEQHNKSWEHLAFAGNLWPHLCETCHAVRTINEECHGCAGRTAGPLTVDVLERNGFVRRHEVAA